MTKAIRWTPEQLKDYESKVGRPLLVQRPREAGTEPAKKAKYNNKKVEWNGILFDSRRELDRYLDLLAEVQAGNIGDLMRQVTFVLAPAVHMEGNARKTPALRYVADFIYVRHGRLVVEDAKGMKTRAYLQKKHLMKTVHGIDIKEV
jgi:hypothetical protein